jgi:hypothetical protein
LVTASNYNLTLIIIYLLIYLRISSAINSAICRPPSSWCYSADWFIIDKMLDKFQHIIMKVSNSNLMIWSSTTFFFLSHLILLYLAPSVHLFKFPTLLFYFCQKFNKLESFTWCKINWSFNWIHLEFKSSGRSVNLLFVKISNTVYLLWLSDGLSYVWILEYCVSLNDQLCICESQSICESQWLESQLLICESHFN